ncbi:MAG TPA: YdeI/OmpD-associated family protein [Clostridia bacterium]|nr:YdeI/OmpD-associated family protein [Clostridia bacterium]
MKQQAADLPTILFESQPAFEEWLKNNTSSLGVWLQLAKKNSSVTSVTYDEAVESALCYGWIDSQKKAFDEKTWIQKFTPRGAKSYWSKVNTQKAEALIASGRMTPHGLRAIETAKQNGNWDNAYTAQSIATLPEDFAAELQQNTKAKSFYDSLNSQNKYAIIFRLQHAKKPETRTRHIAQFLDMLEKGEKIYP